MPRPVSYFSAEKCHLAAAQQIYLFVDQNGIVNFFETTLFQNPESGREAIGRILEYAANAYDFLGKGKARLRASEFWNTRLKNVDDIIMKEFGTEGFDMDTYWSTVEENLRNGDMRLIIATDELSPEAGRIIKYLNKEMHNAEILALELKRYGIHSQDLVLEPGLKVQTPSAIDKKVDIKTEWKVDALKSAYSDFKNKHLGIQLKKVVDWAAAKGIFMQAAALNPTFGLQGKSGDRLFSFFVDGSVYCFFNKKHYPGAASERNLLIEQFKAVKLLDYSFDTADVSSGQILAKKLYEISDDELDQLLNIIIKYCI